MADFETRLLKRNADEKDEKKGQEPEGRTELHRTMAIQNTGIPLASTENGHQMVSLSDRYLNLLLGTIK